MENKERDDMIEKEIEDYLYDNNINTYLATKFISEGYRAGRLKAIDRLQEDSKKKDDRIKELEDFVGYVYAFPGNAINNHSKAKQLLTKQ